MTINHIGIYVADIEKIKHFFVDVFNAQAGEKYVNPAKGFSSYFLTIGSGAKIEIMSRSGISPAAGSATCTGYHHISFSVGGREQVDAFSRSVTAHGYPILDGPRLTGDGFYEFLFAGPENIYIEVTE